MTRHHLTLYDYSDRELLLRMIDLGDAGGWVSVYDLADALEIDHKRPGQCVGVRMGWMRRYGATERKESVPEWRPTRMGRALATGDLDRVQREVLDGLEPEQMLTLTRTLTTRYRRVGATAAHLMRREWTAGTHGRKFS